MILVDTSCWVDFYRPGGNSAVRRRVAEAMASREAAVCGMVYVEFLAFVRDDHEGRLTAQEFAALPWLETGREEYAEAVAIGRALRSQGVTVPATDLVIAAVAIRHGATLYHADDHFDAVCKHTALRAKHLRRG